VAHGERDPARGPVARGVLFECNRVLEHRAELADRRARPVKLQPYQSRALVAEAMARVPQQFPSGFVQRVDSVHEIRIRRAGLGNKGATEGKGHASTEGLGWGAPSRHPITGEGQARVSAMDARCGCSVICQPLTNA
jgi:hypothetical protein